MIWSASRAVIGFPEAPPSEVVEDEGLSLGDLVNEDAEVSVEEEGIAVPEETARDAAPAGATPS